VIPRFRVQLLPGTKLKPDSNPYRPGDKVIVAPEPSCYYGKLSQNLHEAVQLGGVYTVAEVKGNYLILVVRLNSNVAGPEQWFRLRISLFI
jgi:hypothetical protein